MGKNAREERKENGEKATKGFTETEKTAQNIVVMRNYKRKKASKVYASGKTSGIGEKAREKSK